jgi:hypothetical protein
MSSFSSDQSIGHIVVDGQMVPTTQRARVTSIQAEGIVSASVVLKSGGAAGAIIVTYRFGTEGLNVLIPGSGILFKEGVYVDLTDTPGVTITFT